MNYLDGQNIGLLIAMLFWALPWKGFAMWYAAKLEHKKWFAALLVINTMGVADILYLLFYNKSKKEKETRAMNLLKKKIPFLR